MYISNRYRVIHYSELTAKPLEDRDLNGGFLYLHSSSPQQHTFYDLTKWFQIEVFFFFFSKKIFGIEAIDEEHFLYFFVFVLQFEI